MISLELEGNRYKFVRQVEKSIPDEFSCQAG